LRDLLHELETLAGVTDPKLRRRADIRFMRKLESGRYPVSYSTELQELEEERWRTWGLRSRVVAVGEGAFFEVSFGCAGWVEPGAAFFVQPLIDAAFGEPIAFPFRQEFGEVHRGELYIRGVRGIGLRG
jgi:hypothetical protein